MMRQHHHVSITIYHCSRRLPTLLFPCPTMSLASSFFEGASHMQFFGGQSFTNANKIINNNNYPACTELESESSSSRRDDDKWLTLRDGQRLRRIDMCDILILRELSSEMHRVSFELKSTNPFRNRMGGVGVVKFKKRVQGAEIVEFGHRRFSIVSLEFEDDGDVEKIQRVLERVYETALSRHRVWFTQLFGVARSTITTLIYHDEIVDAETVIRRYSETPIVLTYLNYRYWNSVFDVQGDGTLQKLSILISTGWMFNLRTRSFQYDILTSGTSEEGKDEDYFDRPPPLLRDCNPLLDSKEIIRALPDFLEMVSSFGGDHPGGFFVHHDVLTFGTVIDLTRPGILAYFPSISSPVWSCQPSVGTSGIVAKYSKSVPSLVDLTFVKDKDKCKMVVRFSLRLPLQEQLWTAYLVQSFPFYSSSGVSSDLVFIDDLGFELRGACTSDPSSCDPPKYLHVPPLFPELINDMPCLHWPPDARLFYWSFDHSGRTEIAEEDWEKYGIPKLKVVPYFGSIWFKEEYEAAQEYLYLNKYDLHGRQFANDHGYPTLVVGDPHIQAKPNMHTEKNMYKSILRKKGKGKQSNVHEPNSQIDVQVGRIGEARVRAIVEISD
ncbi:hypothetical protein E1B28_010531 [Marasmius oreades]|uniref:Uncharacterized protein n=1 Tax=Marasmius oreades TaxID=181124 RepID=A0A9P7UST0_9AGAR|nr:uncharacterized protein E1B28_010531 [Marasmius oreades]KAG7091501.1 hypothetical protein E1B28_010531 [Marasmius oreades]